MLKIVVFDGGWGGELVANYLSGELMTVDVQRVIDWENAPYDSKTLPEIERLSSERVRPYVGKADLIVLGGYAVSLALGYLERQFPEQKFIGMGINYYRILKARNYPSQVAIFVDSVLIESTVCQEIRQNLPYSTIIAPDCSGWEELINLGEMSKEILQLELRDYFRLHLPEVVSVSAPSQPATLSPSRSVTTRRPQNPARPSQKPAHPSGSPARSTQTPKPSLKHLHYPLLESLRRQQKAALRARQPTLPALPRSPQAYPPTERIRPDVVLLLNTHFWEIRPELEDLFGYEVRVLDFRQKLLHDTCVALKLRGVDGCRSK